MSRKGENIYKRKDGRWEGRYMKARNEQGKIIYGYIYGKRYAHVKQRLAEMKIQYPFAHNRFTPYQGTVENWLDYWLNTVMRKKIKPSTYSSYRLRMDRYIIPYLGRRLLTNLKKQEVEAFICYLEELHLAGATIQSIMVVLKSALNKAYSEKLIFLNPCQDLTIPTKSKREISALSKQEQLQIEQAAFEERGCSAIILALYTGLRIGEISGLKWSDIDFEKNIIYIKRTLYRIPSTKKGGKTEIIITEPKTKSSLRSIPLAKNLKTYLLNKKMQQTSEYVIACKGSYSEPRVISYRFKKVLLKAKMKPIHFHVLRHTFATRCVEQGIDIAAVSKLLGHASIKLTLDTYTDSLWESRKEAVSKLDEQLKVRL
ncbi:tyrosine-type recombinase/integrase [Erwinia sp. CPCC 100877]|nr:tyrosine-type recombinase/integrase [Erwinia sp. CPCC 100877]